MASCNQTSQAYVLKLTRLLGIPEGVLKAGRSLSTICTAFSLNIYIIVQCGKEYFQSSVGRTMIKLVCWSQVFTTIPRAN